MLQTINFTQKNHNPLTVNALDVHTPPSKPRKKNKLDYLDLAQNNRIAKLIKFPPIVIPSKDIKAILPLSTLSSQKTIHEMGKYLVCAAAASYLLHKTALPGIIFFTFANISQLSQAFLDEKTTLTFNFSQLQNEKLQNGIKNIMRSISRFFFLYAAKTLTTQITKINMTFSRCMILSFSINIIAHIVILKNYKNFANFISLKNYA